MSAAARPPKVSAILLLLLRATRQLDKWQRWYGRAELQGELPLPPAGDVELQEDIDEATAALLRWSRNPMGALLHATFAGREDPGEPDLEAVAQLWELAERPAVVVGDSLSRPAPAEVWRAAMTLANNLAVQVSDRHRDDDENVEASAAAEVASAIRGWLEPEAVQLDALLVEAGVPQPCRHRWVHAVNHIVPGALFCRLCTTMVEPEPEGGAHG